MATNQVSIKKSEGYVDQFFKTSVPFLLFQKIN